MNPTPLQQASSLQRTFARHHIEVPSSVIREAIAEMRGAESWEALTRPTVIESPRDRTLSLLDHIERGGSVFYLAPHGVTPPRDLAYFGTAPIRINLENPIESTHAYCPVRSNGARPSLDKVSYLFAGRYRSLHHIAESVLPLVLAVCERARRKATLRLLADLFSDPVAILDFAGTAARLYPDLSESATLHRRIVTLARHPDKLTRIGTVLATLAVWLPETDLPWLSFSGSKLAGQVIHLVGATTDPEMSSTVCNMLLADLLAAAVADGVRLAVTVHGYSIDQDLAKRLSIALGPRFQLI